MRLSFIKRKYELVFRTSVEKEKKELNLTLSKLLKSLVKQEKYNIVELWIKIKILKDSIWVNKITKKIK